MQTCCVKETQTAGINELLTLYLHVFEKNI